MEAICYRGKGYMPLSWREYEAYSAYKQLTTNDGFQNV